MTAIDILILSIEKNCIGFVSFRLRLVSRIHVLFARNRLKVSVFASGAFDLFNVMYKQHHRATLNRSLKDIEKR